MPAIQSILNVGSGGIIVETECHLSNSLPAIIIVGLGNKAVDEARERVRSAFASSALAIPRKRITINLAPADTPKESTSFDLAIALAILQAGGMVTRAAGLNQAVIGELGLDGNVRAVRGIIGKLRIGKQLGITTFLIPAGNLNQALLVPGITLIPIQTLAELHGGLAGGEPLTEYRTDEQPDPTHDKNGRTDLLYEVIGQESAKRALCIAAAGGHNILLNGPPGTGKSMLAKCLPTLLPPMTREEMLEVTHLHSLTGSQYDQLITMRPFRAPHHSASNIALIGGGSPPRPGEISLAHYGVLFLDEMPEFSRQSIESLRQPLEERHITIARAKDTVDYPADFILIATANPCPCGYYGTTGHCSCPAHRVRQYRQKLSGPLMDRIDLHVDVEAVEHQRLLEDAPQTAQTHVVAYGIEQAHAQQYARFHDHKMRNSTMTNQEIRSMCHLDSAAKALLDQAAQRLGLSARSYMRVARVSRTIADLAGSESVATTHITEALRYRPRKSAIIG